MGLIMTKKKIIKCTECVYYLNKQCNHASNKGIEIRCRKEFERFIKPVEELNQGDCKNYEQAKC